MTGRALARAITRVEAGEAEIRRRALALDWPERARIIGLTGPPGVGKSALLDRLAAGFAAEGRAVGALAVDPSSPRSGGALLGDRVRLGADDGAVFFRSMAARDGQAGIAPEVPAALRLVAAGGAQRILLETAGAGQGDHAVTRLADVTVAAVAPGLGDAVQAAKAGLFEVADIVVVNQADRPGAEATAAAFRAFREGPVLLTSAKEGTGIGELLNVLEGMLAGEGRPATGARRRLLLLFLPAGGAIRLHHVGIAARDAAAARDLWGTLLDLREAGRYRVEEFGVLALFWLRTAGRRPAGGRTPAEAACWRSSNPWRRTARSPVSSPGAARGCTMSASRSRDIRSTLAALEARGVRLVDREPRRGAGGHHGGVHPPGERRRRPPRTETGMNDGRAADRRQRERRAALPRAGPPAPAITCGCGSGLRGREYPPPP